MGQGGEVLTSPQMLDLEKLAHAQPPRVWVLTTEKLGDNAQVLAIADALGWPYELKHLEFTSVITLALSNPSCGSSR